MVTCKEIATRICAHLKRFEADPIINKKRFVDGESIGFPYYHASAWESGRWIGIKYVEYQNEQYLTKSEAEEYLNRLDAGKYGQLKMRK